MDFTHHTIDLRPFKYSFSYSNPSRVFFINKVISAFKVSDASEVCKCSPMQKKKTIEFIHFATIGGDLSSWQRRFVGRNAPLPCRISERAVSAVYIRKNYAIYTG